MVRQPGDRLKGIPLENDDDDQHSVQFPKKTRVHLPKSRRIKLWLINS